jgi:hypothetical protein
MLQFTRTFQRSSACQLVSKARSSVSCYASMVSTAKPYERTASITNSLAICTNEECDNTVYLEFPTTADYCWNCRTHTMVSALVFLGVV